MAGTTPTDAKAKADVCLGCELDRVMIQCFESANGVFVTPVISKDPRTLREDPDDDPDTVLAIERGEPIVISEILTAAWKCGGMSHLAGYEQRDAHEFLHGLLETLGKHTKLYRERVHKAINLPRPFNSVIPEDKNTEHGTCHLLLSHGNEASLI